jgi:hypothetical protein
MSDLEEREKELKDKEEIKKYLQKILSDNPLVKNIY